MGREGRGRGLVHNRSLTLEWKMDCSENQEYSGSPCEVGVRLRIFKDVVFGKL
jgi:hypothetical protein